MWQNNTWERPCLPLILIPSFTFLIRFLMSADLIEYLIEYCVENGHKSMHYIRAVALSWDSQNIRTVEEAKANTLQYHKNYYSVLKAYGIRRTLTCVLGDRLHTEMA